jgi:hypothetical protein
MQQEALSLSQLTKEDSELSRANLAYCAMVVSVFVLLVPWVRVLDGRRWMEQRTTSIRRSVESFVDFGIQNATGENP